ncbi:hypothetical protein ACOMHN_025110 [Nucella lapillus]
MCHLLSRELVRGGLQASWRRSLRVVPCPLCRSDLKGIAISFFHRRPDRVVAVNTALKTVSTVGRLWDTEGHVMRWALFLQEYAFDVGPIKGENNIFADLLSRAEVDQTIP